MTEAREKPATIADPAFVEVITPEQAADMLSRNTKNRPISRGQVEALVHDMRNGQFLLNGETIVIGDDGTIIDGQHRLTACVQANIPFRTYVARGVAASTRDTIDIGRKRTLGDVLSMSGVPHATTIAAIARRAQAWDTGSRRVGKMDTRQTMLELEKYVLTHPDLEPAAAFANVNGKHVDLTPSLLGFVYYMCVRQSYEHAKEFFYRWTTGIGITEGDPVKALVSALRQPYRLREVDKVGYVFSAWNHDRRGHKIQKLQAPKGGWSAENISGPL